MPFDELQAEQIAIFRTAWAEAGWEREPRVSVSRSVLPIAGDLDRRLFGNGSSRESSDQLGVEYNARLLETIAEHIAPAIGWRPVV